jgi:hypothetical protein
MSFFLSLPVMKRWVAWVGDVLELKNAFFLNLGEYFKANKGITVTIHRNKTKIALSLSISRNSHILILH